MSQARKTAIIVCPGRGTYNKSELGYLYRYHADKPELIQSIDDYRQRNQQPTITELDQAKGFDPRTHTRGDNASSLIYACAYADFLSINRERFDIVGITGNSMGWYVALACANSLNPQNALTLINTMGNLMHTQAEGGQLIYPLLDENWQPIPGRTETLNALLLKINQRQDCELYDSILLGGMRVFAGNNAALDVLMSALPETQNYPIRLPNHAAFHSPLMQSISEQARELMPDSLFQAPEIPLIDGRATTWQPLSSDTTNLWEYTLGHQIIRTYDFTRAVQASVQEFAPDCLIIPGPGNTLGGATAQALIDIQWRGLQSKQDFLEQQQRESFLLYMGLEEQRPLVVA